MEKKYFDVVVIGAGSGGLTCAVGLAKAGQRVLLVEREHLGGECTNTGCIPSKALLHHAKTYWQAKTLSGETTAGETYRQSALRYVKSKISEILEHETVEHFATMGITVVWGEATFIAPQQVWVDSTIYTYKKAVVATGSRPRLINIPGLTEADTLTNQTIFDISAVPEKLLIIGSGPIGLELGQAFAMLGSRVTIATIDDEIGRLEDEAVRPFIIKSSTDVGITFVTNAHIRSGENRVAIFDRPATADTTEKVAIPFDKVLVAIGRVPNIPTGLREAQINHTTTGISVDSNYRTSNRQVYALGDVTDRLKFTHQADAVARGVVKHIVSHGLLSVRVGAVPKVTYLEPEIAQVGMHWHEAVDAFGADRLHRLEIPLTKLDRSITDEATAGVLIVIVKRLSGKILGAHLASPRAGEIIALFTLAIDNRLSLWRLGRTTYAYPTYTQIIKLAATTFLATQFATLKSDVYTLLRPHSLKIILLLSWIIALVGLFQFLDNHELDVLTLSLSFFTFITTSWWAPLLFIIVYALRPITFLPATAITILAGSFFGFWWGLAYTIIGANLSATLAYVIGRFFSNKTPTPIKRNSLLTQFTSRCQTSPFMTVLIMRLVFLPYDLVNYGAGILRIPFGPYLFATIIGTLLGSVMFVAIGASVQLEDLVQDGFVVSIINFNFIALSIAIFMLSFGISHLTKRIQKANRTAGVKK